MKRITPLIRRMVFLCLMILPLKTPAQMLPSISQRLAHPQSFPTPPVRPLNPAQACFDAAGAEPAGVAAATGAEALAARVAKKTVSLRGLPFQHKAPVEQINSVQLEQFLHNELVRAYPAGRLQAYQECLRLLGLISPTTALEQTMLGLMQEQVAGLYDYHTDTLYLMENAPFSPPLQEMILAHELCHALQNQHFHLADTNIENTSNEDRQLASAALAEGDASLLMMRYVAVRKDPESFVSEVFSTFAVDQKAFNAAPASLQSWLLFPYLRGILFLLETCQEEEEPLALEDLDGQNISWECVNEVWRDPPVSTEQILHPDKYYSAPRDEPIEIQVHDLVQLLGAGWTKAIENTFGELGLRLVLETCVLPTRAQRCAAGWGGDRYALLHSGEGKTVLLWRTVWDEAGEAEEFFPAVQRVLGALKTDQIDTGCRKRDSKTVEIFIGDSAAVRMLANAGHEQK